MNTIKDLIDKYCPDGVEYKKLGEVCNINRGVRVVRKDLQLKGEIPVYQNSLMPLGYFNKSNCPKESVYVISAGAAGDIGYSQIPFWAADDCLFFENLQGLQQKFIYYYLCSRYKFIKAQVRRASVPRLSRTVIENMTIPVPPLPIQREIVRILDSFTSLEAELEAELEARRKQYEYYRDQLLSFKHLSGGGKNDVEWKTLPQISQNLDSKRKPIKSSRRIAGMYPYYGASGIVDYVEDYIFDGDFLLVSEDGANLLARTSKIAFSISGKNWVNNHAHVLSFNDAVRRKFVEFYIENLDLSRYISAGAQPKLTKDKLNSIPIPQPPYEKQQEIVSILDRFESLVNDITTGLPAEIAARHQQYEYYRDQLLSFKRKS